jgi:hypothetical protein
MMIAFIVEYVAKKLSYVQDEYSVNRLRLIEEQVVQKVRESCRIIRQNSVKENMSADIKYLNLVPLGE